MIEQIGSVIGIIIVFGLVLYGSYYCSKKVAGFSMRQNQSKYIRVLDRISLGQDKQIAVVAVGKRYFLVSISNQGTRLVAELEEEDLTCVRDTAPLPENMDFKGIFQKLGREKDSRGDKEE